MAGDQKSAFIGAGAFYPRGGAAALRPADFGNPFVEGDTNGDGLADFSLRLNGLVNLDGGRLRAVSRPRRRGWPKLAVPRGAG